MLVVLVLLSALVDAFRLGSRQNLFSSRASLKSMSSGGETSGTPSSNLDKQGITDALRGVGAIASASLLTGTLLASTAFAAEGAKPNPKVFFDMQVGDETIGRVIFELYTDKVPKTAENFRSLCAGDSPSGITFKNSRSTESFPDSFCLKCYPLLLFCFLFRFLFRFALRYRSTVPPGHSSKWLSTYGIHIIYAVNGRQEKIKLG
jgi:hypothetical protein